MLDRLEHSTIPDVHIVFSTTSVLPGIPLSRSAPTLCIQRVVRTPLKAAAAAVFYVRVPRIRRAWVLTRHLYRASCIQRRQRVRERFMHAARPDVRKSKLNRRRRRVVHRAFQHLRPQIGHARSAQGTARYDRYAMMVPCDR